VNTGGGGGGAGTATFNGGNGGSGIVILKYSDAITATFSGGVTAATTSVSGYTIKIITAAGTTDTVTWSA
jgi:hypothetical protein